MDVRFDARVDVVHGQTNRGTETCTPKLPMLMQVHQKCL